jgi:glycerol-3-phosphate O-acyltransferase
MTTTKTLRPAGDAVTLLDEPGFIEELAVAAAVSGRSTEQARKYAARCLAEIAATPSESWLAPAARFARFVYTRSYERKLDINTQALEELRELSRDHLLLFLWSHKSHMDSFAFLVSLYENGFKPLPLVFAGINMNFLGFGTLARKVGAIFLRREFQDDPVYKLVFRHYIDYLIRNRLPLTWSIEGTRSRTGKLSPPKLGILNWVLEACERENMTDVKFVPVSIAFDRIAEIDDYVALQQGLPKRKESLRWFMNYVFGMKEPYGKIYVRYAPPVSIGDVIGARQDGDAPCFGVEDGVSGGASLATRVAFEVCTRIEQVTPIKAADVLTMVLLGADGRALTVQEIYRQAREIAQLARERGLSLAQGFSLEGLQQVSAALLSMRGSKLVREYSKGSSPVYYIPEDRQLAAAYYRNTITHYFLAAALGEVSLALGATDISVTGEEELRERVGRLRELLKFEFFFRPRDEFFAEVVEETTRRYPQWSSADTSLKKQLRQHPPRFGHAILRSIIEAYCVVAVALQTLGDTPVANEKRFTANLLHNGREMLLRRQISGESSISSDLYATGLKLARHRGLLEAADGGQLAARREAFLREVHEVLAAVNLLQQSYDSAWFALREQPTG